MSAIGYPDFFKPRDWLAGLGTQQLLFVDALVGGILNEFLVPAGKTMVLTRLYVQVSIVSVAGGAGSYVVVVEAAGGLDGNSAPVSLQVVHIVAPANFGVSTAADLPHPLQLAGGAAGNQIRQNNAAFNLQNQGGRVMGYGALLN